MLYILMEIFFFTNVIRYCTCTALYVVWLYLYFLHPKRLTFTVSAPTNTVVKFQAKKILFLASNYLEIDISHDEF